MTKFKDIKNASYSSKHIKHSKDSSNYSMTLSVNLFLKLIFLSIIINLNILNIRAQCVPSEQRCNCDPTNKVIDCRKLGLTKVPADIPETVTSLYLDQNEISDLSEIGDMTNLVMLSLNHNNIASIQFDVFDNMDNLQRLLLSYNKLSSLDDDVFEWNPLKLEEIDFSHNQFKFVQHFLFYDLERIQTIDLSGNEISMIHPHAFQQLKELRSVDISNNHLRTFDPNWIKHMSENGASNINIKNNPWSCDCGMGAAVDFVQDNILNYWFNDLSNTDIICDSTEDKLKELNNKNLKDVNFSNLPCEPPIIQGISKSSKVNKDRSIKLRCQASGLPKPSIAWIAPNKDVYRLNSDNFKGVTVDENGNLIINDLKETDAGNYTCQAISAYSKYNVAQASMRLTIVSDATKDDDKLTDIFKGDHHNSISVNENCPALCSCSGNRIDCSYPNSNHDVTIDKLDKLPKFSDKAKIELKTIASSYYLNDNKITYLSEYICSDLSSLEELKVDNNEISVIDKDAFTNCDRLRTLSLRNNRITHIPHGTFSNMEKLQNLVLDGNELVVLEDATFHDLRELKWLYLRESKLKSIHPKAFSLTPNLNFVHFEKNEIQVLKTDWLDTLLNIPNVETKLFLAENPIYCDCKLEDFINKKDYYSTLIDTTQIVCQYPARNRDKKVSELIPADATCKDEDYLHLDDDGVVEPDLTKPENNGRDSSKTSKFSIVIGILLGFGIWSLLFFVYKKYNRGAMLNGRGTFNERLNYQEICNQIDGNVDASVGYDERQHLSPNTGNNEREAFI